MTEEDASDVIDKFSVALSSNRSSLPALVADEFRENMNEQKRTSSLKQHPKAEQFLSDCLDCQWEDFGDYLHTPGAVKDGEGVSEKSCKNEIAMIRQILLDYHVNCSKPVFITRLIEHAPFTEYVIPVFKYFSAWTRLISFMW